MVEVTKLNIGQYSEARFGQDFYFRFSQNAGRDSEIVICSRFVNCELGSCDMNSILGSIVPLCLAI